MRMYVYKFSNNMVEVRVKKMYKAEIVRYEKDNDCKLVKVTRE